MKILLVTLLFSALLLISSTYLPTTTAAATTTSVTAPPALAGDALLSFCNSKCKDRCAVAGMKDRCLNFCGTCCKDCKCVPHGTYGNKDDCPCYRDKKNSKGGPKCP